MQPLIDLSAEYGIPLVEDAAQAFGARFGSVAVGSLGSIGCHSFFPSKNLGGFGDGGLVTTNDPSLYERARLLRNHGAHPKYYHHLVGGNFRLDALQCALLRPKLIGVDRGIDGRRRNAAAYADQLARAGVSGASNSPLRLPESCGCEHTYNQYVVRVTGGAQVREGLRAHLTLRGVQNEVYYPVPLHLQPSFEALGGHPGDHPRAEAAANDSLALPIFPGLTPVELTAVVAAIADFF
jgi:dTDP-4-amino-4,6-dideoxygalactose transaminase